jgi:hypothetical protein
MDEFNCSDCMLKNYKILLLLGVLFWLVNRGSRRTQSAGLVVFDQLTRFDLKGMSTVDVQIVPIEMQMLSCAYPSRSYSGSRYVYFTYRSTIISL